MPERERDRIKRIFEQIDKDNVGYLDEAQFAKTWTESRASPSSSKTRKRLGRELVQVCDKTLDGRVTFEEFQSFVLTKDRQLLSLFNKVFVSKSLIDRFQRRIE